MQDFLQKLPRQVLEENLWMLFGRSFGRESSFEVLGENLLSKLFQSFGKDSSSKFLQKFGRESSFEVLRVNSASSWGAYVSCHSCFPLASGFPWGSPPLRWVGGSISSPGRLSLPQR